MTAFTPANEDNAITSVVFVLDLDRPIPPTLLASLSSSPNVQKPVPWLEALPAVSQVQPFMHLGPHAPPFISGGVQYAYLRPNGLPIWLLNLGGNQIRVECSLYTRWERVWGVAKTYLFQALAYLTEATQLPISITTASLHVSDSFAGAPAGYDIRSLFRDNRLTGYVPFERGNDWHVFLGWFEPTDWGRMLHNFNAQAAAQPSAATGESADTYSVTVTHALRVMFDAPLVNAEIALTSAIDAMHKRNKDLITELLNDETLATIGLAR